MKNKRAWTVGAVLMALALGGAVLSIRQDWTSADAARPVPSTVEASAASVAAPPRPSLPSSSASAPDPALASASPADTLSPRARRMRDDWCGYGQTEAIKDELAAEAARPPDEEKYGVPPPSDADRIVIQATDDVKAEWIRTLRARSDVRSQAIADYVAFDAPGARAHLQDLARRSTDPMVTALALRRPCAGGCTNIDAAQWSRLEPDNAMAWAAQLQRKPSSELLAYVIDRMQRTQRHDDYNATLAQTLAALAQTRTPGLRQTAELNALIGLMAASPILSVRPLSAACREGTATPAACEAIAFALWDSPSLLQRGMALSMVRGAVPAGAPQRAAWEQRALEYDATSEAYYDHVTQLAEVMPRVRPEFRCQFMDLFSQSLQEMHRSGEWDFAKNLLAAHPLKPEALAERARAKRDGRSLLDRERTGR